MPQPLSRLVEKEDSPKVIISPDAAAKNPALAALVAQAISICSESDYFIGRILIDMLGPQAAPAFAMYEALAWGYSKKQALRGMAAMVLRSEECIIFEALLKVYGEDEAQRNKFAHWVWCYCEQAQGHLILVNPFHVLRERIAPLVVAGSARSLTLHQNSAEFWCYSKAELESIVRRFTETITLIESFRAMCECEGETRDRIRDNLKIQPRMAEALRHPERPTQTPP